jgi:hypothetical protein
MITNKHPNMMDPPVGKSVVGTSTEPLNELEKRVISPLDEDKVSDLSEYLFTLNNRHIGPIAGAYVAVCIVEGKEWCVGQLNADRAKPLILFEDKIFNTPEDAQIEAGRLKEERGESVPCRNH